MRSLAVFVWMAIAMALVVGVIHSTAANPAPETVCYPAEAFHDRMREIGHRPSLLGRTMLGHDVRRWSNGTTFTISVHVTGTDDVDVECPIVFGTDPVNA